MRIQPPKREHKLHHRPTTASRGPAHTCGTPLGADIRVVAGTPAASRPAGYPVALRAPSDPAEVSLSINVLMHVPPPPSTLIFKGLSVSRMLVHRSRILLFIPSSRPLLSLHVRFPLPGGQSQSGGGCSTTEEEASVRDLRTKGPQEQRSLQSLLAALGPVRSPDLSSLLDPTSGMGSVPLPVEIRMA